MPGRLLSSRRPDSSRFPPPADAAGRDGRVRGSACGRARGDVWAKVPRNRARISRASLRLWKAGTSAKRRGVGPERLSLAGEVRRRLRTRFLVQASSPPLPLFVSYVFAGLTPSQFLTSKPARHASPFTLTYCLYYLHFRKAKRERTSSNLNLSQRGPKCRNAGPGAPSNTKLPYVTVARSTDESTLLGGGSEFGDISKFNWHVYNICSSPVQRPVDFRPSESFDLQQAFYAAAT
ncbi:hypothetical protein THAOC_26986 [Thalassiosira oceanica]|uniref:Uncharacterized protein n=1 Tax=Thalassiosira oceanica TaxID=159749 RepID=K0RIL0_THAOC|nr:hypothetical protein THAOC_26986 [Thalassiosira oceanica]|eukprot:EJK53553.1 hypothetical protein THAOC_26986 [Thalassiosira oceanica]